MSLCLCSPSYESSTLDSYVAFCPADIYDFHLSADYEILNDANDVVALGSFILPDINSATIAEEELKVDIGAWIQAPNSNNEGDSVVTDAVECRKLLVSDVRKSVLKFVEQFNSQFLG